MSLINEMLCDLEKRRKREGSCLPCNKTPVAMAATAVSKLPLLAGGILLLAGIIWIGIKIIPGMLPVKSVVTTFPVHARVAPAVVVEKESIATVIQTHEVEASLETAPLPEVNALDQNTTPVAVEKLAAELLSLKVVETADSARLNLTFAQPPEYRLLQNGGEVAQLIVNFSQTQIGADFEVPPLSGILLKRVSLVPQKGILQLLVDLDKRAQVQSFQLVDDSIQGYRFLIKIVAAVPMVEEPQKPLSIPDPKPILAAETKNSAAAKVSKNQSRLSREQQAYRSGLAQLKQGSLVAAEENFNQALIINPKLQDARLQLVALLQQQMKIAKAEETLQQGLALTPENPVLRKIYARLLLSNQRQSEAIDLLKTEPLPSVAQDLEYHALLAALLQESGQFDSASSLYGQLLQVRPQEALWWMGMAISLEQSGSFDPARDAYQKAISLSGLSPDLQNYIHGRLQTL